MAKIIINDKVSANGKLSVDRTLNEEKTGFIIEGVLSTHLYFEEINTLEIPRLRLEGVEVFKESFGSDDYNVYYYFVAKKLIPKGEDIDGAHYILYGEEMKMIEDEMYKNSHPIMGDIGSEYKEMIIEENDEDEEENSED